MNMRYEQIRKNLFRSEGSCWSTSRRTTCTFWPALTSASPFPLWMISRWKFVSFFLLILCFLLLRMISRWKSGPTKHFLMLSHHYDAQMCLCTFVQTNKTHSFVPRCAFARLTNATKIKLLQRSPWTFQTRLSEIFLKSEYHSIINLSQIIRLSDIFFYLS